MSSTILTRNELYNLVWSTPMTKLAKQYSITDYELRKVCQRMNIPLPKSGHWEKLRLGKIVEVVDLPMDYSGVQLVSLSLPEESTNTQDVLFLKRKTDSEKIDPAFIVPDKLTNPDKLIMAASQKLKARRDPNFSYQDFEKFPSTLNISVEKENEARALKFMDSFIKVVRSRGHKFITEDNVQLVIGEEKIKLCLRELSKRVTIQEKWRHTQLIPTGKLTLIATFYWTHEITWKDSSTPLESQLQKIVGKLEERSEEEKDRRLEIEKGWAERDEEDRKRKEREATIINELSEFKKLFLRVKRWKEASYIRDYLKDFEVRAMQKGGLKDEEKYWLDWARKKADWFDPEIEEKDELLDGLNKYELSKSLTIF
jgi:hypothetical protein